MSELSLLGNDLLPPTVAMQLDRVCDQFELSLKSGPAPAIEPFLNGTTEPDRSALLRELLILELSYRDLQGTVPDVQDYLARFPQHGNLVLEVFRERDRATLGGQATNGPSLRPTLPYSYVLAGMSPDNTEVAAPTVARIGKYRVVQQLGSGGQGDVYRAVHPNLPGRDVVVKWARDCLPPEGQQQLLAEGQILAQLDEPGLVRVYDVDLHEGRPFAVFEYVPGQPLNDWLGQHRPSCREAALLIAELAHTLGRVHAKGILHRDLKPHNILIDHAGRPRLLDFGLAWLQCGQGYQPQHGQPSVSGTPQYMPPEQAAGRHAEVGPASDVFGLGAVLYEMLTGQPPYQGPTRLATWELARIGEIAPPRQLNPRLPRALEAICLKALAAEPKQRYASAGELERALRRWLRRPRLIALAAVVLLLVTGVAILASQWPKAISSTTLQGTAQTQGLSGDLILRVWNEAGGKLGVRIDHPGALPVRTGEMVHVEVQLNEPAYCYLLLLDSQGQVNPLYPWNPELGFQAPPPTVQPVRTLHSPPRTDKGWELDEHSGLETILLLARRTPLPADYDLKGKLGKLPVTPLRHRQEYAVRGLDRGQVGWSVEQDVHRGFAKEAKHIDEPLVQLIDQLQPDFELIRLIRFAHVGD